MKNIPDLNIKYELLCDVRPPDIGTKGSLGIDVFIPNDFEPIILGTIYNGNKSDIVIKMGIKFEIDGPYGLQVNNKSGISTKLTLIHGAELIDNDYRGELMVHIINAGRNPQMLEPGMKIVQLLPILKPSVTLTQVDSVSTDTERGEGRFGSTDNKKTVGDVYVGLSEGVVCTSEELWGLHYDIEKPIVLLGDKVKPQLLDLINSTHELIEDYYTTDYLPYYEQIKDTVWYGRIYK